MSHSPALKALWLGIFMGGLAAFLYTAPAYWLSSAVSHASQGKVLLLDPKGSLWSGDAQLALSSGLGDTQATALPGRVQWHLRFHRLNGGEVSLFAPCCMDQQVNTQFALNGPSVTLALGDAWVRLPAHWLQSLGAPWNTVQLRGELALRSQNASVQIKDQDIRLEGQIQMQLNGLSSRLSTVKPLGSYLVAISGAPTLGLRLTSLENSRLILNGVGEWRQGRLHFDGVAQTAPGDENTLSNLLNVLGQRHGNEAQLHFE
jgi:general secretion pathway protein N